jgi:hypothetical protein
MAMLEVITVSWRISALLIFQRHHLNDVSAFTGSKMQSIAVCCQSPPVAMRTHVTKQQILLQIVHHVFSRGC